MMMQLLDEMQQRMLEPNTTSLVKSACEPESNVRGGS